LNLLVEILKDIQNSNSQLKSLITIYKNIQTSAGPVKGPLCKIEEVARYIRESNSKFNYITRDHIIELFFKDKERRLMIVDREYIYYRRVSYVQPPQTLYFGTVKALIFRIQKYGIKSNTKGFIRLYDTVDAAKNFAKQFATRPGDEIVALAVDASSAFSDGSKFSTHETGEYIVTKIESNYVKGIVRDQNA